MVGKLKPNYRRSAGIMSIIRQKQDCKILRLSVFRSNRHFYVQLIDDVKGETLLHVSTLSPEVKQLINNKLNKNVVCLVAKVFYEKYIKCSVTKVIFDRGKYSYKGIIADFVDNIRSLGVNFS